jgi:hypothetical protein
VERQVVSEAQFWLLLTRRIQVVELSSIVMKDDSTSIPMTPLTGW